MKICAVSDLHGRLPDIPDCDVLLIAGDICPDTTSVRLIHLCDPDMTRLDQMGWLADDFARWCDKVPAKRILCTPGNHDFIIRFPENVRAELFIDELVEHEDKRFYFTPWVNPCGPWNYQMDRARRKVAFADIPKNLDVLVSHSPAYRVGDRSYGNKIYFGKQGEPCGCEELRREIYDKEPRFQVFGHIHEGQRYGHIHTLGKTICFNCAMWGLAWQPVTFEI